MTDPTTLSVPPRPFQNVPGRDTTKDRAAEFDIARFYYDQRFGVAEDTGMLNALIGATRAEYDLAPPQWAQWYSVALGFRPDLILELGRSKGNSTALFCQAANRLGRTRVVSVCNSKDWVEETLPRLKPVVAAGWFDPLDARMADILDTDYEEIVKGSARVLVLWDAHGFEIAEVVLGRILPLISDRPLPWLREALRKHPGNCHPTRSAPTTCSGRTIRFWCGRRRPKRSTTSHSGSMQKVLSICPWLGVFDRED